MSDIETIVFGGGCFWCTEAVFRMLRGVVAVRSGYAGGTIPNPTYEQVCGGKTGYAEVVEIQYRPAEIALRNLLTVFFATHDPTSMNRQGNDTGTQYRSVIFYTNDAQRELATRFIAELNASSRAGQPIVTELKSLDRFYPAEQYHQNYYAENPQNPYCAVVINPKLEKVQKEFANLLNKSFSH